MSLIRGMPTVPKVFLAMLDVCGLCPAAGPTLKRPCAGGGTDDKYQRNKFLLLFACVCVFLLLDIKKEGFHP